MIRASWSRTLSACFSLHKIIRLSGLKIAKKRNKNICDWQNIDYDSAIIKITITGPSITQLVTNALRSVLYEVVEAPLH